MKQSKYYISEYWRNKISQNEVFWSGLFENQPINRNSIIINPVILNSYSNQDETAWAVYPNPNCVLGFMKFIYLPTAFIGLIKAEIEHQYFFQEDLGEVLSELRKDFSNKNDLISKMEKFYYDLNDIWDDDNQICLDKLKKWTIGFNENWEPRGVSFSLNVFGTLKETVNFIIATYEEDLGIELLEDDIEMTKDEFMKLADDEIYENEFMKRKFIDILTNRLNVVF